MRSVAILLALIVLAIGGCSGMKPEATYPVDRMVDPVTEGVPDVIKP
jgi:hypothetical protein